MGIRLIQGRQTHYHYREMIDCSHFRCLLSHSQVLTAARLQQPLVLMARLRVIG